MGCWLKKHLWSNFMNQFLQCHIWPDWWPMSIYSQLMCMLECIVITFSCIFSSVNQRAYSTCDRVSSNQSELLRITDRWADNSISFSWASKFLLLSTLGPLGGIFSWSGWAPFSRLTFGAYLMHPILQQLDYKNRFHRMHMEHFLMVILYILWLFKKIWCR